MLYFLLCIDAVFLFSLPWQLNSAGASLREATDSKQHVCTSHCKPKKLTHLYAGYPTRILCTINFKMLQSDTSIVSISLDCNDSSEYVFLNKFPSMQKNNLEKLTLTITDF